MKNHLPLFAAALAFAFALWLALDRNDASAPPPPAAVSTAPQSPPAQASAQPAPAVPALVTAVTAPAAACREQTLSFTLNNKAEQTCVGATETLQTGNVRRYAVSDPKGWSLSIEARGQQVVSVEASNASGLKFECTEAHCAALSIGKHDAQGRRSITLSNLLLRQTGGVGPAEKTTQQVSISGQLKTKPDTQVAGLECASQGVQMVNSTGSATAFCPMGGAGIEFLDDGQRRYEFSSLDAGTLYVVTDAGGRVQKVEFDNGLFQCAQAECGGVSISGANDKGERVFAFSNTMLREMAADPTRPATMFIALSGTLVLPGDL